MKYCLQENTTDTDFFFQDAGKLKGILILIKINSHYAT